ncbi:FG-GAP repeat protein [Vibrio sp. 10N.261.49.A12]|uniref:FG-GAP repeat protein n=1 Tax=Vibrio sp. 10N.261.49.A12 TaxID=3229667 RepID=UPI003553859A
MKAFKIYISLVLSLSTLFGCNGDSDLLGDEDPCTPIQAFQLLSVKALGDKNFIATWENVSDADKYEVHIIEPKTNVANKLGNTEENSFQFTYDSILDSNIEVFVNAENSCSSIKSNELTILNDEIVSSIGYLKRKNGAMSSSDFAFGGEILTLSADGRFLALGAPSEDNLASGLSQSGAVYIYEKSASNKWEEKTKIQSPSPKLGGLFGGDVDFDSSGNRLVVSAVGERKVFVFDRREDNWDESAVLISPVDSSDVSEFGDSISISDNGNRIVVGDTNSPTLNSGVAHIYTLSNIGWSDSGYIQASDYSDGDNFGSAVKLNAKGNQLVVGAPRADNTQSDSGAVYVFSLDSSSNWRQLNRLASPNEQQGDLFGNYLDMSSDGSVIVASKLYDFGVVNQSQVYIFSENEGEYELDIVSPIINDSSDQFGVGISISPNGKLVAVAAPFEGASSVGIDEDAINNDSSLSGAVYLFEYDQDTMQWIESSFIKAIVSDQADTFGYKLDIVDDFLAVFARGEDSASEDPNDNNSNNSGAVYIY